MSNVNDNYNTHDAAVEKLLAENKALAAQVASWRMASEMIESEDFFWTSYNEEKKEHDDGMYLCALMNDVFNWASADAERVAWDEIPAVHALWLKDGQLEKEKKPHDEVLIWACQKRGNKPQKPLFDKLAPETRARLNALPRAGDVPVSVGDGKVVNFDDGWSKPRSKPWWQIWSAG